MEHWSPSDAPTFINSNYKVAKYLALGEPHRLLCLTIAEDAILHLQSPVTDTEWKYAIKKFPNAIKYASAQTPELMMMAVTHSGMALEYIRVKTKEVVLAAVQENALAIQFVPEEYITPDMLIDAVKANRM